MRVSALLWEHSSKRVVWMSDQDQQLVFDAMWFRSPMVLDAARKWLSREGIDTKDLRRVEVQGDVAWCTYWSRNADGYVEWCGNTTCTNKDSKNKGLTTTGELSG